MRLTGQKYGPEEEKIKTLHFRRGLCFPILKTVSWMLSPTQVRSVLVGLPSSMGRNTKRLCMHVCMYACMGGRSI